MQFAFRQIGSADQKPHTDTTAEAVIWTWKKVEACVTLCTHKFVYSYVWIYTHTRVEPSTGALTEAQGGGCAFEIQALEHQTPQH